MQLLVLNIRSKLKGLKYMNNRVLTILKKLVYVFDGLRCAAALPDGT